MFAEPTPTVVHKRHSFLSVLAICGTLIVLSIVATVAGVGLYALRIVHCKTADLTGLAAETIKALPEYAKVLPPVLADAFDDVRAPDYVRQLEISVHPAAAHREYRGNAAVVEVRNAGEAIVSLLAMRVLAQDSDGGLIREAAQYAATPLQVEGDWRGPILPGQTRRFVVCFRSAAPVASYAHEITEVRIWNKDTPPPAASVQAPER